MKKILFVAAAATLLAAGCQKTEVINPVSPTGEPAMSFSTGMNKLTKATTVADGITNLRTQNFSVWAYGAYEDDNTEKIEMNQIYDDIENLAVTYDATNNAWGTKKEYYWPGVDKSLYFFAVSANGAWLRPESGTAPVTVTPGDNPSMTIAGFTVDTSNPNEDLMVADFIKQHQGEKVVALDFHHALSKVEFVFKTNASSSTTETAPNVFVQNVKVTGLANKGTLTVTPQQETNTVAEGDETSGDNTTGDNTTGDNTTGDNTTGDNTTGDNTTGDNTTGDNTTGDNTTGDNTTEPTEPAVTNPIVTLASLSWGETQEGSVVFTDGWDHEADGFPAKDGEGALELLTGEEYNNKALKLTTDDQTFTTWLMLPQSIVGKKVEITYVINQRQFKSIFSLETTSLKNWGCNQYIKYTIILAPNVISFNPSVEDWDEPTDVGYQN